MKKRWKKLKSNKGFTLQDVAIAIVILVLFTGLICGLYTSIYKIQAQTKLNSTATLYAIRILENIDKISYDEVNETQIPKWKTEYAIPDGMKIELATSQYNTENTIKKVILKISYEFSGKTETLLLEKYKAKEI